MTKRKIKTETKLHRKFDGKTYYKFSTHATKEQAVREKERIKSGYYHSKSKVRVTKSGKRHIVWMR